MGELYLIVATVIGWMMISDIQANSGMVVFTTISNYFWGKLFLSAVLGFFAAPFYIVYKLYKMVR